MCGNRVLFARNYPPSVWQAYRYQYRNTALSSFNGSTPHWKGDTLGETDTNVNI